jgi:putative Holliday junction resolvase
MSSQVAEKMMLSMDISRQRRAERIDKLAATYILQGFLDAKQFSK